jgi:hypothetical protein
MRCWGTWTTAQRIILQHLGHRVTHGHVIAHLGAAAVENAGDGRADPGLGDLQPHRLQFGPGRFQFGQRRLDPQLRLQPLASELLRAAVIGLAALDRRLGPPQARLSVVHGQPRDHLAGAHHLAQRHRDFH